MRNVCIVMKLCLVFLSQPLEGNISKVNVLPLNNVSLESTGEYVCKAETSSGQYMQSAWLEVYPGKQLVFCCIQSEIFFDGFNVLNLNFSIFQRNFCRVLQSQTLVWKQQMVRTSVNFVLENSKEACVEPYLFI